MSQKLLLQKHDHSDFLKRGATKEAEGLKDTEKTGTFLCQGHTTGTPQAVADAQPYTH